MMHRPTLIFDGDCGFCRRWIERWKSQTERRVAYVTFQRMGNRFPEVTREQCESAVHLVEPDGRVCSGADAVVRLFDFGLRGGSGLGRLLSLPPLIWVLRIGYRIVARHRQFFSAILPR